MCYLYDDWNLQNIVVYQSKFSVRSFTVKYRMVWLDLGSGMIYYRRVHWSRKLANDTKSQPMRYIDGVVTGTSELRHYCFASVCRRLMSNSSENHRMLGIHMTYDRSR